MAVAFTGGRVEGELEVLCATLDKNSEVDYRSCQESIIKYVIASTPLNTNQVIRFCSTLPKNDEDFCLDKIKQNLISRYDKNYLNKLCRRLENQAESCLKLNL